MSIRLFSLVLLLCTSCAVNKRTENSILFSYAEFEFFRHGELCFFGTAQGYHTSQLTYVPCDKIPPSEKVITILR